MKQNTNGPAVVGKPPYDDIKGMVRDIIGGWWSLVATKPASATTCLTRTGFLPEASLSDTDPSPSASSLRIDAAADFNSVELTEPSPSVSNAPATGSRPREVGHGKSGRKSGGKSGTCHVWPRFPLALGSRCELDCGSGFRENFVSRWRCKIRY